MHDFEDYDLTEEYEENYNFYAKSCRRTLVMMHKYRDILSVDEVQECMDALYLCHWGRFGDDIDSASDEFESIYDRFPLYNFDLDIIKTRLKELIGKERDPELKKKYITMLDNVHGPVYNFTGSWEYDGDDLNANHLYHIYCEELHDPRFKTYLYQNKVWQPMIYFKEYYDDTMIRDMINDGDLVFNPRINMYNFTMGDTGLGMVFNVIHDLGHIAQG